MRKALSFFIVSMLFCMVCFRSYSQAPARQFGLIVDDSAYNASPRLAAGSKAPNVVPQFSLKNFTPYAGNQGSCASCVCWAASYTALTTSWAYKTNLTDKAEITKSAKSPMFVFVQIAKDCNVGSKVDDALQVLKSQGACSIKDYNPQVFLGENRLPEIEPLKPVAYPFRVKDFAAIFPLKADSSQKVDETRLSIINHQPVIAGFELYESFKFLNKSNYLWQPDITTEQKLTGHAMCVIGYNDYQQTFEVLNSWGAGWGNDGYFNISYRDYARLVNYGYQITMDDRPAPGDAVRVNGDFLLQKFTSWDKESDMPLFETVTPALVNNEYTLSGAEFNQGDYFRLFAKNVTANCYIYVFSIDPENKAEVLYPFSQNATFSAAHKLSSDINEIPRQYSHSIVEIPGNNSVIKTDVSGVDNMCILYCYNPIDNITSVVNKIKENNKPVLLDKIKDVLGDRLMTPNSIRYRADGMSVTGLSNTGDIVPIILKVSVN